MSFIPESILCFDIKAPFATFKTPDTNRGFLTFPFPPKTAILGFLGAILGCERNSIYFQDHFLQSAKIGLQVLSKQKILGFRTNLIQSRNILSIGRTAKIYIPGNLDRGMRTPSNIPLLQDVHFRIFISCEKKKQEELEVRIRTHNFYYPVYCGRANLLAKIEYIGLIQVKTNIQFPCELISLCDTEGISEIDTNSNFSLIPNVPMNYRVIDSNPPYTIELSKISRILYHIEKIKIVKATKEIMKIIKSPLVEQIEKCICFL